MTAVAATSPLDALSREPRIGAAAAFAAALRGEPCQVVSSSLDEEPRPLPAWRWRASADAADRAMLSHCRGATIDIGCGPGRMTEALGASGVSAIGIDVVAEAVAQTRARGSVALERDVFGQLPGEGQWETALLADGNIGIGGDPLRLLRRTRQLLAPGGRVVADVTSPGGAVRIHQIALEVGGLRTRHFPWAVVPADRIQALAAAAALRVLDVVQHGERWFIQLEKPRR